MTFYIPEWLLWTIGSIVVIPLVLFILMYALIGFAWCYFVKNKGWW